MKTLITVFIMMFVSFGTAQTPSELTNVLNETCEFSACPLLQLGCCLEDGFDHPDYPCQNTAYQTYYSTEDVFFQRDTLRLRNARLEFRNGSNFITNGAVVDLTCGAEITFEGGGGMFSNVGEMNQTLGLQKLPNFVHKIPDGLKYQVYLLTGQLYSQGETDRDLPNKLPKRSQAAFFLLKVEGYLPKVFPVK